MYEIRKLARILEAGDYRWCSFTRAEQCFAGRALLSLSASARSQMRFDSRLTRRGAPGKGAEIISARGTYLRARTHCFSGNKVGHRLDQHSRRNANAPQFTAIFARWRFLVDGQTSASGDECVVPGHVDGPTERDRHNRTFYPAEEGVYGENKGRGEMPGGRVAVHQSARGAALIKRASGGPPAGRLSLPRAASYFMLSRDDERPPRPRRRLQSTALSAPGRPVGSLSLSL